MANILKKCITKAVLDIETATWEHVEWEVYCGPWEKCDRGATAEAKNAANTASNTAGQYGGAASEASANVVPFFNQETRARHLFDPGQINTLINSAEGPAAASAATTAGQAASQAARTRNTAGFAPALDQAARERNQAVGNAGLQVGMQDILGAKQLNQQGAAGLEGLYGTDVNAQLRAMGLIPEDINAQVNAGKSGWEQNAMGWMNALKPGFKTGGSGGNTYSLG